MHLDVAGRTVLLTGGTSGIGKEAAKQLACAGAEVTLTARDLDRGEHAVEEILDAAPGAHVSVLPMDLASLDSIRAAAVDFAREHPTLDILINNAGVTSYRYRRETADGFELMFGVNHLGHFLLTNLLLPQLTAAKRSRVVIVASEAYLLVPDGLPFEDLQSRSAYDGFVVYGRSKFANLQFMVELARRLEPLGIRVNALHPGYVATNLGKLRDEDEREIQSDRAVAVSEAPDLSFLPEPTSAAEGARIVVRVAGDESLNEVSGRYFQPDGSASELTGPVADPASSERLWKVSEQLVGINDEGWRS